MKDKILRFNKLFSGATELNKSLIQELNECFLLHGTKPSKTDAIKKQGLDSRLSADKSLFGAGIYLTESSTKADKYAGNITISV